MVVRALTNRTYQAAHDPRPLGVDGLHVDAQALLTVKSAKGVTRGLVLGRKGTAPADFEFTAQGSAMNELVPMQIPQGFHWQETPKGLQPVYTRATP